MFHSNLSLKNLAYLTTLQTLEDFADIIRFIRKIPQSTPKIILYGIEDGAAYATWLKVLYPKIVTGVIAYGPKLNAVLDFADYYPDVFNTIDGIDSDCNDIIEGALEDIGALLEAGQASEVQRILNFNPNANLNNTLDVFSMYFFVAETISASFVASKYVLLMNYLQDDNNLNFFFNLLVHKASTKLVRFLKTIVTQPNQIWKQLVFSLLRFSRVLQSD